MARVQSSQIGLERQLSILEVHQQELDDALTGMESEAERLFAAERCDRTLTPCVHDR